MEPHWWFWSDISGTIVGDSSTRCITSYDVSVYGLEELVSEQNIFDAKSRLPSFRVKWPLWPKLWNTRQNMKNFFSALSSVARKWQKMAKLCPRLFSSADLLLDSPIRRNLDLNRRLSRNFRQCTSKLAFHDVFYSYRRQSSLACWETCCPIFRVSSCWGGIGCNVGDSSSTLNKLSNTL